MSSMRQPRAAAVPSDKDNLAHLDAIFRTDLDLYAATLLRIQTKGGQIVPFTFNRAQRYVDEALINQMAKRRRIRALLLKGRQLGMSTYVNGRFYRKTTLWGGQRTFILTHEDRATQQLFGIVKRFHDSIDPRYRPKASTDNANELEFKWLGGGYRVGTAKNVSGLGRSLTIQNFHGSEVAFWPHADQHFAGVMQAIPDADGTEVILESTANGVGGRYYDEWMMAEAGESEYVPIFCPWFWGDDYRIDPIPEGFEPSPEEAEYQVLYGLDDSQIAWMHAKNIALGGVPGTICSLFRQEYPGNAPEAFQTTGEGWVRPEDVVRARQTDIPFDEVKQFARVLGVDVAGGGSDKTWLIDRQGRKAGGRVNLKMNTDDTMEVAGVTARGILENEIQMAFIDVTGGLGRGVYDRLVEMGLGARVRAVNYASSPLDKEQYRNKRAEMWGLMREWFRDEPIKDIPDDNDLHRHICGPTAKRDSSGRWVLEPKDKIKERLGFSPDGGDALAQTFAEEVLNPSEAIPSFLRDYSDWKPKPYMAS